MGGNSPVRIDLSEKAGGSHQQLHSYLSQLLTLDVLQLILHGCGLASSVVAEEGGYLSIIEPQGQSIYGQLVSMAVDFHQILDVNTWLDVSRLLLNTHSCG